MKVAEKWGIDVIEKYGIDVDDAVQKALEDLHVSRDEVRITVLEKPTKGFLGIGSKLALVRVECKYVGNTYNVKDKQPILDGVWFEQTEFYDICKENGVENLENAFYLKKANQILETILEECGIPEEKRSYYIGGMTDYWTGLEQKFEQEAQLEKKIADEKRRIPVCADLSDEIKIKKINNDKATTLYGAEKREFLLGVQADELYKAWEELLAQRNALGDLNKAILSSAHTEKELDWAILGGIAEGLAGPGAGVATAINAMNVNSEIAARNEINRTAAINQSIHLLDIKDNVQNKCDEIKGKYDAIKEKQNESKKKVILDDISVEQLEKEITIKAENVKWKNEMYLGLELTITNSYIPPVPENVKMCVDGCLTISLTEDDIEVCTEDVPLPALGIQCNGGKENIEVIFSKFLPGEDHEYSFTVKPKNLWVMEI